MGWPKRTEVESRLEFVLKAERGEFSFTQLCKAFDVSRKTGYKWLERYQQEGVQGLKDRSRAPKSQPSRTCEEVVELVLQLRDKRPTWGAKKLKARLERLHPELAFPARSTIHDILKREGRVTPRRRRRKHAPSARPLIETTTPNDVWCTDFKGEFLTGDGRYCYPLTTSDWATRYLLGCHGQRSTKGVRARESFEQLFETYGLPRVILSDNGVPFAHPNTLCRLSALSLWWLQLGIDVVRIQPSHPEQNGRHERMHRTLKAEATRPASANLQQQQARFDLFREDYNHQRPHEALGFAVPAEHYERSVRGPQPWSGAYPAHFEVRKVDVSGAIKLNSKKHFLTILLTREHLGLEEIEEQQWRVYYRNYLLAHLDESTGRIDEVGPTPVRMEWN